MIEAGFVDALNNCIDRLNAGDSVAGCLLRYPQYAAALSPLLEVGYLVLQAQADTDETSLARERQRQRFEQALHQPQSPRRARSQIPFLGLAASIVLILALFVGGAGVLAESSLPGDALYNLKRWTETIRLTLTNDDTILQATFAARRIEEARQLVRLRRQAEMTLTGTVDAAIADGLLIEGLPVSMEGAHITPGSQVEVVVRSTNQGKLIALQIRVIEQPQDSRSPSLTPETTPIPRSTQSAALTAAPTSTRIYPATPSSTREPTAARSRADTPTLPESRSGGRADCAQPPARWVRYIIQPGDTLSGLVVASGGSQDEIVAVNCLDNARYIIAGQIIFLPRPPAHTSTPPPETIVRDAPPTQAVRTEPVPQNEDGR